MCMTKTNDTKGKEITTVTGEAAEVEALTTSSISKHNEGTASRTRRTPPRRASGLKAILELEAATGNSDDSSLEYMPHSSPKTTTKRRTSGPRPRHPHIVTKHNYHDHAADPVDDDDVIMAPPLHGSPKSHHRIHSGAVCAKGGVVTAFPVKLYEMLQRTDEEGLSHIVSWQPHGRCFVVHDPKKFKEMLPKYFKLSKIASFQRQLNLYGFQRLTVGPDKNGYYNELFLRGRSDLTRKIQRVKVKGTGVRAKSNPTEEPNLYEYPAVDSAAAVVTPAAVPSDNTEVEFPSKMYTSVMSSHKRLPSFPSLPSLLPGAEVLPREFSLLDAAMEWETTSPLMKFPSNNNTLLRSTDQREMPSVDDPWQERDLPAVAEGEINFDRLIDEMFSHDQSLDFSDLLKLAAV